MLTFYIHNFELPFYIQYLETELSIFRTFYRLTFHKRLTFHNQDLETDFQFIFRLTFYGWLTFYIYSEEKV